MGRKVYRIKGKIVSKRKYQEQMKAMHAGGTGKGSSKKKMNKNIPKQPRRKIEYVKITKDEYKEEFGDIPIQNRFRDMNRTSKKVIKGDSTKIRTTKTKKQVLNTLHKKADWYGVDNELKKDWETKDYHSNEKGYYQYRKDLHEEILNDILQTETKTKEPIAVLMGGGGGAGKGFVLESRIRSNLGDDVAEINPDLIKDKLPEKEFFLKEDRTATAARLHEESSDLSKVAIKEAIKNKQSFVFDGTMANTTKYDNLVKDLKKNGYKIKAAVVYVDFDVAVQRARLRGQRTGRFVPMSALTDSHSKVITTFKKIRPNIDSWTVYDNSTRKLKVLAENGVVYNENIYQRFE